MVSNNDLTQFAHLLGYRRVDQWAVKANDYQFKRHGVLYSVSMEKDTSTEHGYVSKYTVLALPYADKLGIIATINQDYMKYGSHSAEITYL